MNDKGFEEFTETAYGRFLEAAQRTWQIAPFTDYNCAGRLCLWRHDVDMSVHRALRLATVEAGRGARATYFVHLHSEFYSVFEPEITSRLRAIHALGHDVGLHFDPVFYSSQHSSSTTMIEWVEFEKRILERLLDVPVVAFSIHNPDVDNAAAPFQAMDDVCGMVNAYGPSITASFTYVSDSNGYWRHQRLDQVLTDGQPDRLHVLTHPEWWTDVPLSPRARVARCAEGRSRRQLERYDALLERAGRHNIR
jgi:hypothetical protein